MTAIVYQVQTRSPRGGWVWAYELTQCPLFRSREDESASVFDSASDAEQAREWLIEELDYEPGDVRVRECVVDDEGGGLLPVRDPRPRSGKRVETPDTIKLRLPQGAKARLLALAERDGVTASEWVARRVAGGEGGGK